MEPVFCRLMVVVFGAPPAINGVVVPPYLLIVAQVAVFVLEPEPSVLLQVAAPEVSRIVSVPVLAVFRLFWILATNPAKVGVKVKATIRAPTIPVMTRPRRRVFCVLVVRIIKPPS